MNIRHDDLKRKIVQAVVQEPRLTQELCVLFEADTTTVEYCIKEINNKSAMHIYGNGTMYNPYRLMAKQPDAYTDAELHEIWRDMKKTDESFQILAEFAMCSEAEARKMVERWSYANQ